MTSPDPQPEQTPNLEPGGGVPPGETPPAASSTSGTSYHETPSGRGYNTTALIIIGIIVIAVLAFIIGKVVAG